MRVAVVGHVEWVEFLIVDGAPHPGAIVHASEAWSEPAGGGGVAAVELARLAGSCTLWTAWGDDPVGRSVKEALGRYAVKVVGGQVPGPHRRAVTLIGPDGERTIAVVGEAQAASGLSEEAFAGVDGVYLCKGDVASLRAARAARVVVGTARILPLLREAGIRLDGVVGSAHDPREAIHAPVDADVVVQTEGSAGGVWTAAGRSGRWAAAPLPPGLAGDAYGCGDRFAAGLTFALASGSSIDDAVRQAAQSGAFARGIRGALGAKPA